MKTKAKLWLLSAVSGAALFQFFGCGDGGGANAFLRFLGDAVGTTLVLTGID